jgi:carbamoyltransferase
MKSLIGICDNHDSGACLFEDGKIIFAINEERLNRQKQTRKFPYLSIIECLKRANNKHIEFVIASNYTPISLLRFFNKKYSKSNKSQFSYLINMYFLYQITIKKLNLDSIETKNSKKIIQNKIKKLYPIKKNNIHFVEHHRAHATSAYNNSGFNDSLIITVDSMGDGVSLTVNIAKQGKIKRIYEELGNSAISLYYSRITEYLGFRAVRHEGKVLGLSCYGKSNKTKQIFKKLLHYNDKGGFNKINHLLPVSKKNGIYKELKKFSKEDIAYGLQQNLETEFMKFVKYWMEKTNIKNISVAGGLFANVKLNQRIYEICNKFYVFPHMGDGGLAIGAINSYIKTKKISNLYLGNSYNNSEILSELKKTDLSYSKPYNLKKEISKLLVKNKVVALFQGNMEFGPRALGNRTILYRPDDPKINNWLNKKLKRTEFMPFAPVILKKHAKKCFKNLDFKKFNPKNMTITYICTDFMKQKCSGVVHIDGTARPQIIDKNDNPFYYSILDEFYKLTKLPCLINTSFNMHGEPIVCSPYDAIKSFIESKIDYLVIGPYMVKQNE